LVSHILREEKKLRVFENGVRKKKIGPERYEVRVDRMNVNISFMTCTLLHIIRVIKLRMIWTERVTRVEYKDKGNGEFHPVTGHEEPEALDGVRGQRHAPAAASPGKTPVTHCTGGWLGHRAGLDR